MKKKHVITLGVFLFMSQMAFAQITEEMLKKVGGNGVSVKPEILKHFGLVVDAETNRSLAGAIVNHIYQNNNYIAVRSSLTNETGKINHNTSDNERRIEISCEGYKIFVKALPKEGKDVDLGTIRMLRDHDNQDKVIVDCRRAMNKLEEINTTYFFPPFKKEMTPDEIVNEFRLTSRLKVTKMDDVFFIGGVRVEKKDVTARLIFGEETPASSAK